MWQKIYHRCHNLLRNPEKLNKSFRRKTFEDHLDDIAEQADRSTEEIKEEIPNPNNELKRDLEAFRKAHNIPESKSETESEQSESDLGLKQPEPKMVEAKDD